MRRVALTIVATITGLVLLLQFKVHSTRPTTGAFAALNSAPHSADARRSAGPSRSPSPRHHRPATARPSPSPTHHRPAASTAPVSRSITGQTINTRYGPVQVRIVETGKRLTDVQTIQVPSDNSHSAEIAANAVPTLRREALAANSAHIQVVSGATYTSDGYAQSLQSALDHA